jgi:dihydrofolate reductase
MLKAIFCQLPNGIIGVNNRLPWDDIKFNPLKSFDMTLFKEITYGKDILMGTKTWDSLNHKLLPGRGKHLVLTKKPVIPNFKQDMTFLNLDTFRLYQENNPDKEIILIGGAQLYNQFLNECSVIYKSVYYPHDNTMLGELANNPTAVSIDQSFVKSLEDRSKYSVELLGGCNYKGDILSVGKYTRSL